MNFKSIVLLIIMLFFVGCTEPPTVVPKFALGQIVKSIVSGQRGQVVSFRCWDECTYDVRFNTPPHSTTSGGIAAGIGSVHTEIEILVTVNYMKEFELIPAE